MGCATHFDRSRGEQDSGRFDMAASDSASTQTGERQRGRGRHRRPMPTWALVLVLLVACPLATYGVFSLANLVVNATTVTVTTGAWGVPVGGSIEYSPMCGWGGTDGCPYHVAPGSTYVTTLELSPYFEGRSVTLSVPSPFRLVSTSPTLPASVPAGGLDITITLSLPSTSGEYSFLGSVTFG